MPCKNRGTFIILVIANMYAIADHLETRIITVILIVLILTFLYGLNVGKIKGGCQ